MRTVVKFSVVSLLLAVCVSCSLSKTEWVDFNDLEGLDPETGFVPFGMTTDDLDESRLSQCHLPGGVPASDADADTKTTAANGTSIVKGLVSHFDRNRVVSYSGSYRSVDIDGNPIRLSGRIVLPADGKVSRIMIVSHFTIGADAEAPSNELPIESVFAARGLALVVPDYLGYGLTADHIHPYLCADITAKNCLDMYFAARRFLAAIGCEPEYDDIFVYGFSQGGAVAMSIVQAIESGLNNIKVRLLLCGSGPYDIGDTYDTIVDGDFTDYPCAIPMIIQGLNYGMNLGLDYSRYFLPHMVENMDTWLNRKKYTMAEVTRLIGSKQVSTIMTEQARNKVRDIMTELYKSMVDNSVARRVPVNCPIYLFHSIDDNVVPYVNAERMVEVCYLYGCNARYNFGHYGDHVKSCLRFLLSSIKLLEDNGDIE